MYFVSIYSAHKEKNLLLRLNANSRIEAMKLAVIHSGLLWLTDLNWLWNFTEVQSLKDALEDDCDLIISNVIHIEDES